MGRGPPAAGLLPGAAELHERLAASRFTEADLADGGSDRLVDTLIAQGGAASVTARIAEHFDAGADHVAIQAVAVDGGLPWEQWEALIALR